MCKTKHTKKKINKISALITALFIISTAALVMTIDYFSPNILKQINRSTKIFEGVAPKAYSVVSPSMYRLPKLTDMGAKRLASRYAKGNMMESNIYSDNYIDANFSNVVKDNSIKLETVNNSYDCFVYKIIDEKSSDEWLVGVLLDGNSAGRYVLIQGEE